MDTKNLNFQTKDSRHYMHLYKIAMSQILQNSPRIWRSVLIHNYSFRHPNCDSHWLLQQQQIATCQMIIVYCLLLQVMVSITTSWGSGGRWVWQQVICEWQQMELLAAYNKQLSIVVLEVAMVEKKKKKKWSGGRRWGKMGFYGQKIACTCFKIASLVCISWCNMWKSASKLRHANL